MVAVMESMGDPQRSYPVIQIAGTNGKTTTARMLTAIAAAHGLVVGTYTSPHLERVEERFSVNLAGTAPDRFAAAIADVAPFVDLYEERTGDGVTYFELVTAAAFAWFADQAVELAVVETGLGGRLDATTVADARVAVLTGVALEHTEYLGSTLRAIAGEKVAILKTGGILVTGALPPEAEAAAAARVVDLGAPWRRFDRDFRIDGQAVAVGGRLCDLEGIFERYDDVFLPLHGRHQVVNLAVAVAALEELFGRALDPEAVREGAAAVTSPGRLEVVGRAPTVIIDGAHTPDAVEAAAAALEEEFPPLQWTLVVGALGDKDLAGMLAPLGSRVGEVFAVEAVSDRAIPAGEVGEAAGRVFGDGVPVHVAGPVPAGVEAARAAAGPQGGVLVIGSLYVAGEARTTVLGPGP